MHEMGLALEICRVAEEQVGRNQLARVVTVAVEVGDEAGVEISSLEFCLEALLTYPPFGAAKAVISRRPGDVLNVSYLEVDDGSPDD